MKILSLSVSNIYKPRDGTALAVYNRWMRLGKKHEVTMVLAQVDKQEEVDPGIIDPREYTKQVIAIPTNPNTFGRRLNRKIRRSIPWISRETGYWLNDEVRNTVSHLLTNENFDFVQVEPFPMFWALPDKMDIPIAFNCNDISSRFVTDELNRAESPLQKFWLKRQIEHIKKLEEQNWRRSSAIFTVTGLEAELIKQRVPKANVITAAHGVDLDFLKPTNTPIHQNEIVFIGVLDVIQNIDAARWFGMEILPIIQKAVPEAHFTIVGRNPSPNVLELEKLPGVKVIGNVPDVRPHLQRAHLMVSPVRLGAGMKGKTIEAMAMKKPLVSTTFAAEGVKYTADENILLGDTNEEFASQCIRILNEPELVCKLSENGRALVEKHYSWDSIADLYEMTYEKILGMKREFQGVSSK